MTTNTGGPAFPTGTGGNTPYSNGMDMRDYFAAKAMPVTLTALWALGQHETPIPDLAAKFAYDVADAMLKARGNT